MDYSDILDLLGGGGAKTIGKAVDSGFGMYNDLQKLDMARRQAQDAEKQDQFKRFMSLMDNGQNMQDRLGGAQRLFALRNPGV